MKRLKKEYGNIQVFLLDAPFYNKFDTLIDTEIVFKKQLSLELN